MAEQSSEPVNGAQLPDMLSPETGPDDDLPELSDSVRQGKQFNTFEGVFVPTTLTVLGAIMYLRLGSVVGDAGLGGAILIILLANVITITTALSISSIATNIRVRAGGPFAIISQSLGLEVGGSVSVPFYIAQAISVAFYVFAFTEGWLGIFPDHPEIVVVFITFAVAFGIAFISANFAARTQLFILSIVMLSLFSVFLGSFEIMGQQGLQYEPQLAGRFTQGDFWFHFSIFFPAVTGILAGVNMSGDLKDPRRSIPQGTMSAIAITMVIYLVLAVWLALVASPDDLTQNQLIIADKAAFSPAVLAGILAATFSSALTSLVGAPRLLQAIGEHQVLPAGDWLAKLSQGEPRRAMMVTGVIGLSAIVFGLVSGGLNAIAPLMTMFFLVTYSVLNGVVVIENTLGLISFRPLLRIPTLVSLTGLVGSIVVMFIINPVFSIMAVLVILGLYSYLTRRQLTAPWSDVRSGLFFTVAEWAAKRANSLPDTQERAWKPNLLFPVTHIDQFRGSYRLLRALANPRGSVRVIGLYQDENEAIFEGLEQEIDLLNREGVYATKAVVRSDDIHNGIKISMDVLHSVLFRPNGLFMQIDDRIDETLLRDINARAARNQVGALFYIIHPVTRLGHERTINVWIREQSPDWQIALRLSNLDLALLLAYQLIYDWHGKINLITIVQDETEKQNARDFLNRLIALGRMPSGTQSIVRVGDFRENLTRIPRADLNIMGIQTDPELTFMRDIVEVTRTSTLFVRDSGTESAMA